jgi:2'-5' RNA ligase
MSELLRAFIAIELPDQLKREIDEYTRKLKQTAPDIRWVKSNALHITMKFLGEQPALRIDAAAATLLAESRQDDPFRLTVSEFGAFPNTKRPRVFWLGVQSEPVDPLYKLQNRIEEVLQPLGFEKEERRFSPHLTLARVKFPGDFTRLWDYVRENPFPVFAFSVHEMVLMRSILKPSGAEYHVIQKYPLQRL